MPGSFAFESSGIPLARQAPVVGVFRYDADSGQFELIPNVVCERIDWPQEGAHVGSAQLRYQFGDPLGDGGDPQRFEQVFPYSAKGPRVVKNDDRLAVVQFLEDGSYRVRFDGFAQVGEVDLGPQSEQVTFQAVGSAIREWDVPLAGALMRDADDLANDTSDLETDLPARFNPDGKPNAILAANEVNAGDPDAFPIFVDPLVVRDPEVRRPWTLGMAARYVIWRGNAGLKYVTNLSSAVVDQVLESRAPKKDGGLIDPTDPNTYTDSPIIVQDIDVTGDPWPVALEKLLAPHGFGFCFRLTTTQGGTPSTKLDVYRKDTTQRVKHLNLQAAGDVLDPGQSNVFAIRLQRDVNDLANAWVVDTKPVHVEASFVLAPLFTIAPGDANAVQNWMVGEVGFDPVGYRLFGLDETGEGHWDFGAGATKTTVPDLTALFPKTKDGSFTYVNRRRPGRRTCFSVDPSLEPAKAELWMSSDYAGPVPGVFVPGAEHWRRVKGDDWKLLDDRLGIEITTPDARSWHIGETKVAGAIYRSGKVNIAKALAAPTADFPKFYLRLTCVVDGDMGLDATAKRRASSPTRFTVQRRDDGRDRWAKKLVSKSSHFNAGGGDLTSVDDTADAKAWAEARRKAHELGVFAGSVHIPRITSAYRVGDAIDLIRGRACSLRSNAAAEQKEGPVYPTVVAGGWIFSPRVETFLELSDRRAEPSPERTKGHRVH
jgi:hypothetical protein